LDYLHSGEDLSVWAIDRLGRTLFEIWNVKNIHDKGANLIENVMLKGSVITPN